MSDTLERPPWRGPFTLQISILNGINNEVDHITRPIPMIRLNSDHWISYENALALLLRRNLVDVLQITAQDGVLDDGTRPSSEAPF